MARAAPACARPRCFLIWVVPAGPRRSRRGQSTPSTTLMIAFWCLREITRHLHSACAKCGEPPSRLVRALSTGVLHVGNPGTNPGPRPQSPTRTRLSTVCPPAIHRLSTGVFPGPGDNVGTLPARRPQNLQQAIHTPPQAVDRDVTLSTCPHRFPQDLSTSVGKVVRRCPPLGITPWGWPVDNLGTSNPQGQRAASRRPKPPPPGATAPKLRGRACLDGSASRDLVGRAAPPAVAPRSPAGRNGIATPSGRGDVHRAQPADRDLAVPHAPSSRGAQSDVGPALIPRGAI
jgi:hypothetical protein